MSKIYLISKTPFEFETVHYVDTLKAVNVEEADCVVYHSSNDLARELPLALSSLSGKVSKIIYMNANIDPLLYCVFMGLEADIYDDDSGLEAEDTLMFYIDNYKTTGLTMSPPNTDVDTLMASLDVFTNGDIDQKTKMIMNKYWVETLNRAASNIDSAVQRSLAVNSEVTKVFAETRNFIDSIVESQGRTTEQLQLVQDTLASMEASLPGTPMARRSNTPSYYPSLPVPARALGTTLYIKALSPCRYLVSFILAFHEWARTTKMKDIRVLFVAANLDLVRHKYHHLPQLTEDISFMNMGLSHFITFDPRKKVLDAFFGIEKAAGYVVVDLTYGADILKMRGLKTTYATSSARDITSRQLKENTYIFSTLKAPTDLCIPVIRQYGNLPETQRPAEYAAQARPQFEALLKRILG